MQADYLIIGGGISGCSTAFRLAQAGAKNIVVIERGYITYGSTGRCGAGVRMQWGTKMNCELGKYSIEFYENAADVLEYEGDIEFRQTGYLMIAEGEREARQFEYNVKVQNECGIASKMLTPKEAKELVPHLNADILSAAAYCDRDGFLNPFKTTDAFYCAAKRLGVEFMRFTEVTGFETEGGKVVRVKTNKGDIAVGSLILCSGAGSPELSKLLGPELPIHTERHQILVSEPVAHMQDPMVMGFGLNLYAQQSPHGSFIMGRGDPNEPQDGRMTSSWQFLDEMALTIERVLPKLGGLRVVRQWAGCYVMTPDRQPIYDRAPGLDNAYMALGFSGHGFMFGPVTGVVMRELILGGKMEVDYHPFALSRFAEGKLLLEPAVV